MTDNLWKFIDDDGTFESGRAARIKSLYFPLANETIMSSISPDLHGDIKRGQNSFLLTPASRIDLINLRSSRNFWVYLDRENVWSAAGVSKNIRQIEKDEFTLKAGLLWHEVTRENEKLGIKASILSFVPVSGEPTGSPMSGEPVEVMRVKLTNTSRKAVSLVPIAAIPIYARGANNLRDHRHVTSLLQRPEVHKFGVVTKPTLVFDESGHRPNKTNYFVLGWDEDLTPPEHIYPTEEMFCGDSGDLEAPGSVLNDILPHGGRAEGEEPMGALRFKRLTLKPGQERSYIIVMGITDERSEMDKIVSRLNSPKKLDEALRETKARWTGLARQVNLSTGEGVFDNWFRWVNIQPTLRRIFGCSFLPDFDYGKGGRGWRDLWQDCLGLILTDAGPVRGLIVNNFSGVRIDGSNATIIGKKSGEFISDRNNISRVWMDHGIWPLLTLDLYMNETGDTGILWEDAPYFRDHQMKRAGEADPKWDISYGQRLKTASGRIYTGTVFEHVLVQNLVQFFNVGPHNHIRLEGADWNDGLDMAPEYGESVAFSSMYAHNLRLLAKILRSSKKRGVYIAKEIKELLGDADYDDKDAKLAILDRYFEKTKFTVSGKKAGIESAILAADLEEKASWIMAHIRRKEWLKEGFFNGYYDNKKRRVEGARGGAARMMLSSQVFPILSGTAEDWQIGELLKSAKRHLFDKGLGGYHLNTDFKKEEHDLGRAFSFVYGDKENGAFFNHMIVIFAYALYSRGYAKEGWDVLSSIYKMAADTRKSKIYPCVPEYFNLEGRGMYTYLTGSASWLILTLLTESFGVKGAGGDLLIEPKLCASQFSQASVIAIERNFASRRLRINFSNPRRLDWNSYRVVRAALNGRAVVVKGERGIVIDRRSILNAPKNKDIVIDILLG